MARVLHLMKRAPDALAVETIEKQVAAGDQVTVAWLDAPLTALPAGAIARRVPAELGWDELVDEIFASDHVITW